MKQTMTRIDRHNTENKKLNEKAIIKIRKTHIEAKEAAL